MHTYPVGLTLNQMFAMLRWRLATVFNVMLGTLIATAALTLILPKTYTASADIFIEYRVNDPISGRQFPAMLDESYMQTQVDIIKSTEVANRVIDALHLTDNEDSAAAKQLLAERIIKSIDVQLRRSSRIVEIQYSGNSPETARDYLNALIKAYMDLNLQINSAPAKSRLEQYNAQLDLLRNEIDTVQTRLTEYQQSTGIVDADERLDVGSRQLLELSNKQITLQGQRQEITARANILESLVRSGLSAADIPEIAQQPRIIEMKLRLTDAERNLAELSGVYGRKHPKYIAQQDERDSISKRLQHEAKAVLDATRLENRRLQEQEQAIAQDLASRQKAVLEMKKHRDVLSSYQRQLESSQRIYNAALHKYDEILMSGNVNSTSLSILRQAELPRTHTKPRLGLSLMFGLFVGLVLGLAVSLLAEISTRHVRCAEDIERELGLRMLGHIGQTAI